MTIDRATPLAGRHAVITGGGTGLGLGIASAMVDAGARVTLLGRESVLREAAARLGASAGYLVGDVAAVESIDELTTRLEAIAPIDTLVNNAGTHHKHATLDTDDEAFRLVMQTNVFGTFALTRSVARHMAERGHGSVIMITSMAALFGLPMVAAYTASKSALDGMVRQLAVEFGPIGIRVNAIAPGFIETDMNREIFRRDPQRREKVLARTALGKFGRPADVGEAAVFLASPLAAYLTGVSLPVDGGTSIGF